jgi:uncharacterized repeat protein (TIGR01451 family)
LVARGGTAATPGLNIVKTADDESIMAGDVAGFTITVWNAGPGDLADVVVRDEVPQRHGDPLVGPTVDWTVEIQNPDADDRCGNTFGTQDELIVVCSFGTLPVTDMADAKVIVMSGETSFNDCPGFSNRAEADAGDDFIDLVFSAATIDIDCPDLTLDKVADVDQITTSGPPSAPVANPSVVTWTLSWTVPDGLALTDVEITDYLPAGSAVLSASDGGVVSDPSFGNPTLVTWRFPTLTTDGSVTVRTTIDPATISETASITNEALMDSAETLADTAEFSVQVVDGPDDNTPTPRQLVPNTAIPVAHDAQR